jgi:hypothetical protein
MIRFSLVVAVFCMSLLCLACCIPLPNSQPAAPKSKWYEGGTLHKKGALDWQQAPVWDKLATCADFVSNTWERKEFVPSIQQKITTIEDMQPYAVDLLNELDKATEPHPDEEKNRQMFENQTVAEFSVALMILMRWTK